MRIRDGFTRHYNLICLALTLIRMNGAAAIVSPVIPDARIPLDAYSGALLLVLAYRAGRRAIIGATGGGG